MSQDTNFSLSSFLENLKSDSEVTRGPRLNKLIMNSPELIGSTITYLPVMMKDNYYLKIEEVAEVNMPSRILETKDNGPVWMKILPIEFYGNITEDQKNLHEQVLKLHAQYSDLVDDYNLSRFRRYTLIHGYILKLEDTNKTVVPKFNGPSMMVYPSHTPLQALHNSIQLAQSSLGDPNKWFPLIFTDKSTNRNGALVSSFNRSTTSKGYVCNINITPNSQFNTLVEPTFDYSEEFKLFTDPIRSFLSWQAPEDSLFHNELMMEIRDYLSARIIAINNNRNTNRAGTPFQTPASSPAPLETPAAAPQGQPAPAANPIARPDGMPF